MSTTNVNQLWEFLAGVFSFNAEVFRQISILPNGFTLALLIVLISGLSQAIAESIILFINRVQPVRFIFSLLINAVLYTFGYLFLVFSSWLICLISSSIHFPFNTLARVLGLSYAPLLFSFLGALPYLGVPILWLLSVWHLLAMVVGFGAVAGVSPGAAFWYVAFGWAMLQILQQTIGQPIANLGRWLANKVAGVKLVTNREGMTELVGTGLNRTPSPATVPDVQQFIASARPRVEEENLTPRVSAHTTNDTSRAEASVWANNTFSKRQLIQFLRLLGMVVLAFLVAILLRPVREGLFGWYNQLSGMFRFVFDLVWIGIVALVFAGLLAPLETLGWWAGWYDDEVNTTINTGTLAEPVADSRNISRYVIYLDGICQSSSEYLPDIEDFLDTLVPTLPNDMALIRGLMVYSVFNKPLVEDRPLGFLWRLADRLRFANPTSLLGYLVNLRNVLIVCVSADRRYGPLYNQGIAQVMYNALINNGYQPGSGIPITLIGYSGGGQMSAASARFLRRAADAPIDVISLGGVISGNCNILKLEHLYHLVGEKDTVEPLGPILFPGRWKLLPLSYWNRAKRLGKISFISLGPVGHQVPGGMLDPKAYLPDGRSHLEQTVNFIIQILHGRMLVAEEHITRKPTNYGLYQQAAFNHPDYYPLNQTVDLNWYRPLGRWIGRLILPPPHERQSVRGALFEVHHADAGYEYLVGQIVNLRWLNDQNVQNWVRAVTHDVHFSADAEYASKYGGSIHPVRLNHWRQVDPLESLAGSRPNDDMVVMLTDDTIVEAAANITLRIRTQPVQITGRYYGLVRFLQPIAGTDQFRVVHFNRSSRQFDGIEEIVRLPPPVADRNGCFPSTSRQIEQSLLNETGWYIYGAKDASGYFVVQSLAPRALMRLQPDRVIFGRKPAYKYIRKEAWVNIVAQKGKISSVLLNCHNQSIQDAIAEWQEGDRALLLHTYGGIGGNKQEPAAATPIFFGHFAYGLAQVVREPLADELQFNILYYQIYTHNTDGLVAGTFHWSRYMGDRQFGWAGVRPVCDILVKLDAFTGDFEFNGTKRSVLDIMLTQLQAMTARYRIGDGTGGTYVGPANNCAQDSNEALFASLRSLQRGIESNASFLQNWLLHNPEQARQYHQLLELEKALKRELQPLGTARSDWEKNEYNLGSTIEDAPLRNLLTGLASWKTLLPRLASDTIVRVFLKHNASVWVLRTNQIGGNDPDIEPIAPMTL
ncbi:MAG: CAAX protease [Chlorogloeopsis fritschii C42_A2020_084]|uniref:Yip1 family protein n=1 Tax=Chlorogloeopsis fritschii TaxID=1124 RepID=UPI0019F67834|nr:CAAX protease [Chlorogloeopsis fritschii]MBF2004946.1 CAAX protease [Chlorogloeopsis fritschii C42_A2020_084]